MPGESKREVRSCILLLHRRFHVYRKTTDPNKLRLLVFSTVGFLYSNTNRFHTFPWGSVSQGSFGARCLLILLGTNERPSNIPADRGGWHETSGFQVFRIGITSAETKIFDNPRRGNHLI